MWECGLKRFCFSWAWRVQSVTPYVGVWIETEMIKNEPDMLGSLLMWECGLKQV